MLLLLLMFPLRHLISRVTTSSQPRLIAFTPDNRNLRKLRQIQPMFRDSMLAVQFSLPVC